MYRLQLVVRGRRVGDGREDLRGEATVRIHRHPHLAGADLLVLRRVLCLRVRIEHSEGEPRTAARVVDDKDHVLGLDLVDLRAQSVAVVLDVEGREVLDGGQVRSQMHHHRAVPGAGKLRIHELADILGDDDGRLRHKRLQ